MIFYEKNEYGKVTIEFDEDGKGVIDFEPALFYIPPGAWKYDDGNTDADCPDSMRDRRDTVAEDNEDMPF